MEKPRKKGKRPAGQRTTGQRPAAQRPRITRVPAQVEGARVGRRNILLFGLGLAAIVLGFVLLSLGVESLATILLVGGYLVLIPWAILARERTSPGAPAQAPSGDPPVGARE